MDDESGELMEPMEEVPLKELGESEVVDDDALTTPRRTCSKGPHLRQQQYSHSSVCAARLGSRLFVWIWRQLCK